MRVVFVNRFFHPDYCATSQILTDLAFGLQNTHTNVHVVTSRLRYEAGGERLTAKEEIRGVAVHRVWSSGFGRSTLIGRVLDYLTFFPAVFFCLLKILHRGDIAIAKTDPPLISVAVWLAARWRGAVLVNWLQDLFPEVAAALGVHAARGPLGRALIRLRDRTLMEAAVNVVVGHRTKDVLRARGIPDDRIAVITNWADGTAIKPLSATANPLRQEWGLIDKFVVGYSGNVGRAHEFETIINAAELLKGDPAIVFLFIGGGHSYRCVQAEARRRRLSNIVFKPYQPREGLPQSITLPDVHLVSLLPVLEGFIVPSKFYGAIAAGRPVVFIGSSNGELAREIAHLNCGATVEPKDAAALAYLLQRLHEQYEIADTMGKNARSAFEKYFDKAHALTKWRTLLAGLVRSDRCTAGN